MKIIFPSPLSRSITLTAALAILPMAALGCSSDDSGSDSEPSGGSAGMGGTSTQAPTGSVTEAVLSKCPEASTLIETTEWMSCLDGKRLTGTEPFNNQPCELRIGGDGTFEYLRDGTLAIAVPARGEWLGATGTYQNDDANTRLFLAGIAPDLPAVEGEPRVTNIDISLFELASLEDKVEVRYLDAKLSRQTYNCTVDAL